MIESTNTLQCRSLMAMVAPTGTVYTYHFNPVGSTVAMTDPSRAIVNKYAYAPFGGIIGQYETIPQPLKFVGQFGVMAEPNGLYYMRARYYDPKVGRFISEDPLSFGGGDVNLMAYVGNNPVNRIDPWGLVDAVRAGTVTRVGWQNPNDHAQGFGWRIYIDAGNNSVDIYAHMDPNTTPAAGTWVNAGAYVGDYANPTNGHSTGPHVHYEQRDNGVAVDPGDVNLIQGGTITSPYGDEGTAHPNGHNGIDAILPRTNGCTGGCK